ncbi:TonB-dependent receptor [Novosphingobium sp.]|uniref:TonB-dependent receptor n=1 Tax=Novosphingobium sp. TaxID=1874826 RepID=UPI002621C657|nr:TonB-dependent receptor [Novosphingobium sp.]
MQYTVAARFGAGTAVMALALVNGTAFAQSANAQNSGDQTEADAVAVDDIIVTATRSATSLQNTPIAVTALSGDVLQQKGATSLLDVQNSTPNLTISSRSTTGAQRGGFTIRGIGVDAVNSSSAVGLYVDEVYYPSAAGNLLGLFDVERIEVLRGPQGTLFGRNTIAGAIQYITKKPDRDLGGFVTGTYGNLDRAEIAAGFNLPVGETLAIRASGRYNRQGGYVLDLLNGFKRGEDVTKQGRLAIRWTPSATLTVDLKGEIVDLENNGRAMALLDFNKSFNPPGTPNAGAALVFAALGAGLDPLDVLSIQPTSKRYTMPGLNATDRQDYVYRIGSANVAWDIADDVTLKSITAYSYSHEFAPQDLDNTPAAILGGFRGELTTKLFTQELQLSGKALSDQLKFTLGAYYFNGTETTEKQYFFFGPSPLAIPASLGDPKLKNEAIAGYGEMTFDVTDRLAITGGVRYSRETVTGSFLRAQFPGFGMPTPAPSQFAPLETSFNDWSPSFGVNFQATPDKLFYAKASKGFRAGGTAVNGNLVNTPGFPAVTATPGYQPFGPEKAWTYEAGARLQFLDSRIRINPTAFYTDWSDIQFNSFIFTGNPPTPNIVTRNAGDARIWGLELEWSAAVTRRFSLNGSFSYLNSKYKRIAPGIDVDVESDLQHAPQIKYASGARYVLPVSDTDDLTISADWAWTDTQRSAVSDSDFITQPSYGLLNARIQYSLADGRYTIAAYGTNLTNTYYYLGGINGAGTFGSVTADIGRPREYGVTASVRF